MQSNTYRSSVSPLVEMAGQGDEGKEAYLGGRTGPSEKGAHLFPFANSRMTVYFAL